MTPALATSLAYSSHSAPIQNAVIADTNIQQLNAGPPICQRCSSIASAAGAKDGEDHEEDVDDIQEDGERAADVLVGRHLHTLPRHHQLQVINEVNLHA